MGSIQSLEKGDGREGEGEGEERKKERKKKRKEEKTIIFHCWRITEDYVIQKNEI